MHRKFLRKRYTDRFECVASFIYKVNSCGNLLGIRVGVFSRRACWQMFVSCKTRFEALMEVLVSFLQDTLVLRSLMRCKFLSCKTR